MTNKKISVIMGIYNCSETLMEALDSIAGQTYRDWEIIMCDDASSDNTLDIAHEFQKRFPEQVIVIKNPKNMGLNFTLNKCLEVSSGDYIARMDGDDVSKPTRFEREVKVLEQHPEIAIVSTDMEFFDEDGVWGRTHTNPAPTRESFIKSTPFCHAACMVRREAYIAVDGYSVEKRLLRVEDYHLWIKMYEKGYKGINIMDPLYQMRDDKNAYHRKKLRYRINEAYVKAFAVRHLNLAFYNYIFCMKPLIVGLLPAGIYKTLHRQRLGD